MTPCQLTIRQVLELPAQCIQHSIEALRLMRPLSCGQQPGVTVLANQVQWQVTRPAV
jgi:hypothetical protein